MTQEFMMAFDSCHVVDLYAKESIASDGPVSIIIPSGSVKKTVYVFVKDDDVFDEGDESMSLQIDMVIYGKKNSSSSIQMNVKITTTNRLFLLLLLKLGNRGRVRLYNY